MSPLFVPIVLAVFVGIIVFLVGLITRKKTFVLIGAPAAVLFFAWCVAASIPPNPGKEFDRIFGAENRSAATDIDTFKPTMMDGHFISFRMPRTEFAQRIGPQLELTQLTNFHLLRGQNLPSGWPKSVEEATSALHK